MANDPAFLFYPGDYLRDTQCLSEPVQVAYDRIMCEHMRNICISQAQLDFFTKRLNSEQKKELLMVLKKTNTGFQIGWVAESIEKRRNYSESRRKNRTKTKNISSSYDKHMEIEIVNENINGINGAKTQKKLHRIFSSGEYFETPDQAFNEIKNDDLMVERMLMSVHRNGFPACNAITLMKAVRYFLTKEGAKPDFTYRPRDDVKNHLVNWVTDKAKTLQNYG